MVFACEQDSPVLQCHTTVVELGFHPPEPQLWTQTQKISHSCQHCFKPMYVTEPPLYTPHRAAHHNILRNKQKASRLNTQRPPSSAVLAHRQPAPSCPPTLPVTVETIIRYRGSDHSASFVLCCVSTEAIPTLVI